MANPILNVGKNPLRRFAPFSWRALLVAALVSSAACVFAAGQAEKSAFNSASNAFGTAVWDRAEKQFAEFIEKYPDSTLVPDAILLQAQARFEQTNYSGAIELLLANQVTAGKLADQYVFWLARAQFQSGAYRASADNFERLARDFAASPLRMDAVIDEATARARLDEWQRVIALLQKPDGIFQNEARTNLANELVPRGFLLLSEAQMAVKDYKAAEKTLEPLGKLHLPKLAWQWEYLRCRIQLADGRPDEALTNTANLITQAANVGQPSLQADSIAFKAGILESLSRTDDAIATYKENLAPGFPAERQRQALLKIAQLSLRLNKVAEAAQTIEQFLSKYPDAPAADQALLLLGELRLGWHLGSFETNRIGVSTNVAAPTNALVSAQSSFQNLVTKFPQSSLFGKALLDLGWCAWLQGRIPESQRFFHGAVERLAVSMDQATAFYKLADAQFQQQDFKGALTNYTAVLDRFGAMTEVKTNLFEPALYQIVRAALATGNIAAATNALENLLGSYPESFRANGALLLTAQELNRRGHPAEARQMFLDFGKAAPNARSQSEMQLAIARTYEQEDHWPEAIQEYEQWLACFTNNPARPRAMYFCGWANFQAGRFTNALTLFTNLVAQFPTNEFAPRAQWWVAGYYYNAGDPASIQNAEINYKYLFQNTNFPPSELTWQAQMMAGRVAVKHQGWSDAKDYFTRLYNDTNCPTDLRIQALIALGDTCMNSPDSTETNKFANYAEALGYFRIVIDKYPTNKLAVLAWGEMAICHLQWLQGSRQYDTDTNAVHDFQQVIDSPLADATARSIAKVGLAILLEKQAEQRTGPDQAALLKQALNHYLDVLHGTALRGDEKPDIFWVKKAGIEAARLAESLREWVTARKIYEQLKDLLPPLRARFEKNILKVQEHIE